MRKLSLLLHCVLLVTTPMLLACPRALPPRITSVASSFDASMPCEEGSGLSYDQIINLLDDLESGELEKRASLEELEQVNEFLAYLAKEGILPDFEDIDDLEEDIEALFEEDGNPFEYAFSFDADPYTLTPAVFSGYDAYDVVLCRGWLKKKWKKTKRFVKKHKKEIIIGAAIVVATAAIVVVAVATSSATAVAVAGGAKAAADAKKKSKHEDRPSKIPSASEYSSTDAPNLKSVIDEYAISFKESIVEEGFFEIDPSVGEGLPWEETGRVLAPLFAHESFNHLNSQIPHYPQLSEEIESLRSQVNVPTILADRDHPSNFGHYEIDRRFASDYTSLFTDPNKEADFAAISYHVRGERALALGYYKQATHDFGQAIERNPENPTSYLERSFAHFSLGDYEQSVDDFHTFAAQSTKTSTLDARAVTEFSCGFSKGLPKGVYESGKGILVFLVEFVDRPIHTSAQLIEAVGMLSKCVGNSEWGMISQALAPEICELAIDWDTIPSGKRGELVGYALGKHGADFLTPAAVAKLAMKGLKSSQELAVICKNLQRAKGTLILETAAGYGNGAKVAETIRLGQETTFLAKELGLTGRDIGYLKNIGRLDDVVSYKFKTTFKNPAMLESLQFFKKAETFLKPYSRRYFPEADVRGLIHQTGVRTFPKPKGVPENYLAKLSKKGGGMKYVHSKNEGIYVRVMPGKPHSPFPYQRKPYVIQMKDGKAFDQFGNLVSRSSPDAHIPIEKFVYRK